jgi:hypothetical protein
MSTKLNAGSYDCYAHAEPSEEMFILLGRDRHAAALVQLWALMREKEGEPIEVVEEARACAERLEAWAREKGKAPMTLDVLLMMAASMRPEGSEDQELDQGSAELVPEPLKEGEIVVAGRAAMPAKLLKVFGPDAPEQVRGKANIRMPRATIPTTVDAANLRRALPDEVRAYRAAGGR